MVENAVASNPRRTDAGTDVGGVKLRGYRRLADHNEYTARLCCMFTHRARRRLAFAWLFMSSMFLYFICVVLVFS